MNDTMNDYTNEFSVLAIQGLQRKNEGRGRDKGKGRITLAWEEEEEEER